MRPPHERTQSTKSARILKVSYHRSQPSRIGGATERDHDWRNLLLCNQPQLDALRRIVIPKILAVKSNLPQRRLRIWSAGCSTGEEPYTLRILALEEANGSLKDWSTEILASDLNERSLAHAQAGIYGSYSTRNLTPGYRGKYFLPRDDKLQVNAMVRSSISFSRLNLSDDSRMTFMKSMDAYFLLQRSHLLRSGLEASSDPALLQ